MTAHKITPENREKVAPDETRDMTPEEQAATDKFFMSHFDKEHHPAPDMEGVREAIRKVIGNSWIGPTNLNREDLDALTDNLMAALAPFFKGGSKL